MTSASEAMREVQFLDKYARWNQREERRETFGEAVDRTMKFLDETAGGALTVEGVYDAIREAMLAGEVMPSMRLLNQAGASAKRNNITIYNCAYMPMEKYENLGDLLYMLGHGTGVSYSVESRYVDAWPSVPSNIEVSSTKYHISDDLEGWADSITQILFLLFEFSEIPLFDYSDIRKAGTPLVTKGGTASGPEPLRKAHKAITSIVMGARGRKLTSIEIHDMACHIADSIVSGGSRRSAMLALFDEGDELMLGAKSGNWYENNIQRSMANNSLVIEEPKPFEWWENFVSIMNNSRSGEPGIFSRYAAKKQMRIGRNTNYEFGTNPCGEIVLRPYQFCNLSAAVARKDDTFESMAKKVKLSAIIGTVQASMTDFKGMIDSKFAKNSEEEALLGVDINGIFDSPVVANFSSKELKALKRIVVETNIEWASILGINEAAAATCIKPSGNSGVLLDASSGIHPRLFAHYIRRLRINASSPLGVFLRESGVPCSPENGQTWENATTYVFEFPIASPKGATLQNDKSAVEQLNTWLKWKLFWTEHNPSVTISYAESELDDMANWLYENEDALGGLSFLPRSDTTYALMPKEEITEERYLELERLFPQLDFDKLREYEVDSRAITSSVEYSCMSGSCEI